MEFDMKNMVTYLGCIVLALFVMYVLTNMMKLNRKVVEGMTSKTPATADQLIEQIKTMKTKYIDKLHIDKYKTKYNKILLDVEDILHLQMLDQNH